MEESKKEGLIFAVDVGALMLYAGAEVYRVNDTIIHMLKALEIDNVEVYVLSNGIFASTNEQSIVRNVTLGPIHLGKVSAINQLSRDLSAHRINLEEAKARFETIKQMTTAKDYILILASGIGAGAFAYIFGGNIFDALFGFINGIALEALFLASVMRKRSRFIRNIFGAAFVTILTIIYIKIFINLHMGKIIIGSIMPLVPGIALTTSIRDLFYGDYLSGAIHLLDALLTAMCIAVGVGSVMSVFRMLGGLL